MPIFTDFTPNMGSKEALTAFKSLFISNPGSLKKLKKNLEKEFGSKAYLFDTGSSALIKILEAMPQDDRDEILVQSYTCVVVVNAIRGAGFTPVYVDVDERGINTSLNDLEKKITKKTRAVIVQHTFGFPDKISEIKKLCKDHKLFLIEDLAHSIGAKYKNKLVGTSGDAAFLSFGSGKVISSSRGGAAITKKLKLNNEGLDEMPHVKKHLFKIISFELLKPIYFYKFGKGLLYVFSKLGLLPKVITPAEKKGQPREPHNYDPRLAEITLIQWKKRKSNIKHRQKIAKLYTKKLQGVVDFLEFNEDSVYMRFPIFVKNPEKLHKFMKRNKVLLGTEWSGAVIVPRSIDLRKTKYKGGCKNAEKTALTIINLPTDQHIDTKKANHITDLIKKFYAS